ncbi:MAG: metallopeptidase TldD-related protein [Spirochaetia bacterium]|jgi:PmbA protein|nr:metallopeptidase TldD-related protein [Spirochaetia bacterium]
MKERIVQALARAEKKGGIKAADWRLVSGHSLREERYYVKTELELAREVEEIRHSLTVYVDGSQAGKKTRGEASISLQPSFSDEEIDSKIAGALFAASMSKNPWFDLPGASEAKAALPPSGFEGMDETSRAEVYRQALYAPESLSGEEPRPRINALELFVSKTSTQFSNSKAAHFGTEEWKGYSEFIVEAQGESGGVELFDDIAFSQPDTARLEAATGTRLAQVRDRAKAIPTPVLKDLPVILGGREAEEVFAWFFDNASTEMIFTKASPFELGMKIQQTDSATRIADPLDIWAEPVIPGLPDSCPYDPDGFALERTKVVDKGVLKCLVGGIRYADWLGQPRKGFFPLFSVSAGKVSLEQLRSHPHLELVKCSDFRLESTTGNFGGEIRLAYWFDGKKRIPVTGGSISGSVAELRSTMRRSKERALASRSLCPVAVKLDGVSITGAL